MPDQKDINAAWLQSLDSNAGKITMLVPPKRIASLRKPYDYELPARECREMLQEAKAILKPFDTLLQCKLVDSKPTKYGCRVNLFLLGYRPGYCGEATRGLTVEQWQEATDKLRVHLVASLPDAMIYIDPWSSEKKFQARFETYVLFPELA